MSHTLKDVEMMRAERYYEAEELKAAMYDAKMRDVREEAETWFWNDGIKDFANRMHDWIANYTEESDKVKIAAAYLLKMPDKLYDAIAGIPGLSDHFEKVFEDIVTERQHILVRLNFGGM